MARTRRIVHRIESTAQTGFEERLWPVNLALFIFAGFAAGIILAVLRGHEGWIPWLRWSLLFILAAGLATTICVLRRLGKAVRHRGFQLALVLSLIFHLVAMVGLAVWAPSTTDPSELVRQDELEETEATRDHESPIRQVNVRQTETSEYLKPVEVATPQVAQVEVSRTQQQPLEDSLRLNAVAEPEVDRQPRRHLEKSPRVSETLPRQAESPSVLSRSKIASAPTALSARAEYEESNMPVTTPAIKTEARQSAVQRQTLQSDDPLHETEDSTPVATKSSPPKIARREMSTTPEELSNEQTEFPRKVAQPARVPRSVVLPDQTPSIAQQTEPKALKPNSVAVTRQVATSPDSSQENDLPIPSQPIEVTQGQAQRKQLPDVGPSPVPEPRAQVARSAKPIQPSPTEAVEVSSSQAQSAATAASRPLEAVRLQPVQHMEDSTEDLQAVPEAQSARTALSRADRGVAGAGVASNLDSSLPTDQHLSQVASASARRAKSTQTEQGPALAPSEPSRIPRARAGASTPSAMLASHDFDEPLTAGADQPGQFEASSSAAVSRAMADVQTGEVTASAGTVEVDVGPPRKVSSSGTARASGGGQREPGISVDTSAVARKRPSRSPASANKNVPLTDPQRAAITSRNDQPDVLEAESGNVVASAGDQNLVDASADRPDDPEPGELPVVAKNAEQSRLQRASRTTAEEFTEENLQLAGAVERADSRSGPPKFASVESELLTMAAAPDSDGAEDGTPLETVGVRAARQTGGPEIPATSQPVGAVAADRIFESISAQERPRSSPNQRRSTSVSSTAVDVPNDEAAGSSLARSRARAPSFTRVPVEVPADEAEQTVSMGSVGNKIEPSAGRIDGLEPPSAQAGLATDLPADEGPGGFATSHSLRPGVIRRRSSRTSEVLHLSDVRFLRRKNAAPPTLSGAADFAAPAFSGRMAKRHGEQPGGSVGAYQPKTEEAIELGLQFLVRHQSPNGSWSLHNFAAGKPYQDPLSADSVLHSDTAGTGLALLAFLGAGYHHLDHEYQGVVRAGIEMLVQHQQENGDLYVPEDDRSNLSVALYSHAIATMALCEAYGMTQDPQLGGPAQKAIDYIVQAQHTQRGGWRYMPGRSTDTSVTGWMMMALKSGELASLHVPKETFDKIVTWLNLAQSSRISPHLYVYNPYAPETQQHGRKPSDTMTSVGLLMRMYSGWRQDNPQIIAGAKHLIERLPSMRRRDTYYWYYATQVMFHMGNQYWETWYNQLHPLLVRTQVKSGPLAGTWDPRHPVQDRWGPHAGRLYLTTMNLMSLEIYYRHLPIYEDMAQ